jgi:pimeloyl-ACP methyl ester carboxylesterase
LVGHGESGTNRKDWTISAFANDLAAVIEKLELDQVVLVGHSMGGFVVVEAARRMPDRVIGIVGADSLFDVERIRTQNQIDRFTTTFLDPLRSDFVGNTRKFVQSMFLPTSDIALRDRIVTDTSSMPASVGIGAMVEMNENDVNLNAGIRDAIAPLFTINAASFRPTNLEAAHLNGMQVMLMSGVGHFVMLEDAETFNGLLDGALKKITLLAVDKLD